MNLHDLDIRELERRLELATQAAGCSCAATCSTHYCPSFIQATATTGC